MTTTPEAEEAVADLVSRTFARSACAHTDFETGRITVSVYCEARPTMFAKQRIELRRGFAWIRRCGLNPGAGRITVQRLRHENWAESWKRHFKPIVIGGALLIKPSWCRRRPRKGQAVVVLDPGLSFGTGRHATTWFCLRELARRRRPGRAQSFLDIGTGSGILAIAAAKLGYAPVDAFDCDAESIRVATANAGVNHVQRKLHIARRELTGLPHRPARRYDLICANLLATLLRSERKRIARRLNPGGALVVAGVLRKEFRQVRDAFSGEGLHLVAMKREREWQSATFVSRRIR